MTEDTPLQRPRRVPIWQAMCDAGLADSEARARALILAGQVLVHDRPVPHAGTLVPPDAPIRVRGVREYASRGGHKLEAALREFAVDAAGRVALDAGASTGGFTDCLLQHGARRVYAVDVGYGQLLGRLRQDPRVVNFERTNLAQVGMLALDPAPTLVTLDLSYLSLAEAWRLVRSWLPDSGDVISLVKPLFEIDDAEARRTGRIVGQQPYVDILGRLARTADDLGWSVLGGIPSPIRGSHDTLEFLLHVRAERGLTEAFDPTAVVAAGVMPEGAGTAPRSGPRPPGG